MIGTNGTAILTASTMYSISQGARAEGPDRCHYCGEPCQRWWLHTDPPLVYGKKRDPLTRCPGNHYICTGCFFFRKPRLTVCYLTGGYKDVQCPMNHSWWITDKDAWGLRKEDYGELYNLLLKPPCRWALLLRTGDPGVVVAGSVPTLIHAGRANENAVVESQTELYFTLNNVTFSYTIYELEQGIRYGEEGRMAGVRELMQFLGPCPRKEEIVKEMQPVLTRKGNGAGRPKLGESDDQLAFAATRKVLTKSGKES